MHGTLLVGVRAFAAHASARERTWKRESVVAPPCIWELDRFGASLLGTAGFTPCNEHPACVGSLFWFTLVNKFFFFLIHSVYQSDTSPKLLQHDDYESEAWQAREQ